MESKVMMVCVIVGILGAIAAALGFAAEAKRVKASQVEIDYYSGGCVFPRSTAVGLGVGAALALLFSQIIISFQTGCFTSKYAKLPNINWSSARLFSFISRVAFGIGLVLLLAGVAVSSRDGGEKAYYGYVECYVVKPGIFASAAIFSLVSVAFGILFYLNISAGITTLKSANVVDPSNSAAPPPPPPQATAAGFNYDVEQPPQIPPHKPY